MRWKPKLYEYHSGKVGGNSCEQMSIERQAMKSSDRDWDELHMVLYLASEEILPHRGRRDAYLEGGKAWVCLQERTELPSLIPQLGVDHVAFYIDSGEFHTAVEVLRQANLPIVRGPIQRGDGWTVIFLNPDGIQVELYTGTLAERMMMWV